MTGLRFSRLIRHDHPAWSHNPWNIAAGRLPKAPPGDLSASLQLTLVGSVERIALRVKAAAGNYSCDPPETVLESAGAKIHAAWVRPSHRTATHHDDQNKGLRICFWGRGVATDAPDLPVMGWRPRID